MPTSSERRADVLIVGGGVGGVAAAHAAARLGLSVILTEETPWVGGQLTSQAVPPDEHPWIERAGRTASYAAYRTAVRQHYRSTYPLSEDAATDPHLNPGAAYVSALAHEPRASLAVLNAMLAPYRARGDLDVLDHHRPISATGGDDRAESVGLLDLRTGNELTITATYVIDATETGALLPLTGTEYVTGSESRRETDEPHAPSEADHLNMQAITFCFAVDHHAGEDHTIERPRDYGFWRHYSAPLWPGPLLSWTAVDPQTLDPAERVLIPNPEPDAFFNGAHAAPYERGGDVDLWLFRRILARRNFVDGFMASDITLVNWPMIDYWIGPIIEVDDATSATNLEQARQLSLSFLYWMQTEASRPDGGTGYPGLRLRTDVVGTDDGLAMAPYVRESRRIRAQRTIVEQDLSWEVRKEHGAVTYPESIGVGSYRIDLHPSTAGDSYIDIPSCPFEIPLGALIPQRLRNLLPAAKNIGTTHITNGCFRLHPVEWNVGEVAGLLAAFCLECRTEPLAVFQRSKEFGEFTRLLDSEGIERRWPHDIVTRPSQDERHPRYPY